MNAPTYNEAYLFISLFPDARYVSEDVYAGFIGGHRLLESRGET